MSNAKQMGAVSPTIRWPGKSRLSEEERSAIDVWTRDVEQAVRSVVSGLSTSIEAAAKTAAEAKAAATAKVSSASTPRPAPAAMTTTSGGDPDRPVPPPPPTALDQVSAIESNWFFSAGPL